jgi:hypothetical protein
MEGRREAPLLFGALLLAAVRAKWLCSLCLDSWAEESCKSLQHAAGWLTGLAEDCGGETQAMNSSGASPHLSQTAKQADFKASREGTEGREALRTAGQEAGATVSGDV